MLKSYEIVLRSGVKVTATPTHRNEDFPAFVAEVKLSKEPYALVNNTLYLDIHEIAFVVFDKIVFEGDAEEIKRNYYIPKASSKGDL